MFINYINAWKKKIIEKKSINESFWIDFNYLIYRFILFIV